MADVDKTDVAKREEEILTFWKENRIFEKSLEKAAPKGEFVFYDGPPFATGLPHAGSLLSSIAKDVIPRYKTMRGYRVRRRWGWDTHGLPIESLVEKKLGLKNKKEILAVGVQTFNETARSMVLEYVHEWKRYIERVGRWVDFDNSYKTMDSSYIESVWWALKEIHKKGRLYEGRKVLMYCPHCETPLAKAEIAMDNTYKDVTEEAVTVKFKVKNPEKHGLPENTFILAWTTTPWTLPANVALAVGPDIEYVIVRNGDEYLVIAKALAKPEMGDASPRTRFGRELVGIEYEPLYEIEKVKKHQGKKWQVLPADFVTTGEGAGIVHTAVIYGEDDFALGKKEGLPMIPLLNPNATYNDDAPEFIRGQYIKKAEALIKTDLESRGLLFAKASNTHSYPHCYRCGTPLIYNAVPSWFINIQAVKKKILDENRKINWVPGHLKHGRFKHILENAPDWTISRNRFWASPLPIWKDKEGIVTVIGSLEELKARTKKSGNRYFAMRHGEAGNNVMKTWGKDADIVATLTKRGEEQVTSAGSHFRERIDIMYSSPYPRARQSAERFAAAIGYPIEQIVYDDRLKEWDESRKFEGCALPDLERYYIIDYAKNPREKFEDGESFVDLVRRVGQFMYDLEQKHSGKKIFIVAHHGTIRATEFVSRGMTFDDLVRHGPLSEPTHATVREVNFSPLPHNDDYELDYHLPYIDRVELIDEKGGKLTRIPEVVDCWVESGAMPFAEYHYPFENKREFEKRAPGDFVSEYIGQTRAWFYYMHAVAVGIFGRMSFKNVITTGNVLAADGEKLSKSKGNYTDPYVLFDRFGADAFRYYLMSSVVMQAEDVQFKDDDLKEVYGRIVNILRNTHAFYLLYKDGLREVKGTSTHILDRWILSRLNEVVRAVTKGYDSYDVIRATRPVREFVEDFSTWYVRRSRDRMKGEGEDTQNALRTMREVLHVFSRVIAPVMPFIAEEIFLTVRHSRDPESVHLTSWPNIGAIDEAIVRDMAEVRKTASLALEARSKANIKVRQPLSELKVRGKKFRGGGAFVDLLKEEVNVKKITFDASLPEVVVLDTTITAELKEEGELRDLVRAVQDLRKQAGLSPKDAAILVVDASHEAAVTTHWDTLRVTANLSRKESGDSFNVRAQ